MEMMLVMMMITWNIVFLTVVVLILGYLLESSGWFPNTDDWISSLKILILMVWSTAWVMGFLIYSPSNSKPRSGSDAPIEEDQQRSFTPRCPIPSCYKTERTEAQCWEASQGTHSSSLPPHLGATTLHSLRASLPAPNCQRLNQKTMHPYEGPHVFKSILS